MATGTAIDVVMPQMGVSVSEGTITRWLKNVGDPIVADESLLEISTDKVDTEVPSPGSGVVSEILVQEGETVEVGTVLARIGGAAETAVEPEPPADEPVEEPAAEVADDEPIVEEAAADEPVVEEAAAPEPEAEAAPVDEPPPSPAPQDTPPGPTHAGNGRASVEGHSFVSPVVARIAAEHGIDPSDIPGTGRDGRVKKKDILAFVASRDRAEAARPTPSKPAAASAAPPAKAEKAEQPEKARPRRRRRRRHPPLRPPRRSPPWSPRSSSRPASRPSR